MTNIEKKLVNVIQSKIDYIFVAIIAVVGFVIRYNLLDAANGDIGGHLLPWYEQIKANGGIFGGLSQPIYSIGGLECNYSFAYQFCIAIMTELPLDPVHAYKIFSCIFDYLNAVAAAYIVSLIIKDNKKWYRLICFSIVLIHPVVFINSAFWGQCDGIYTFFLLLTFIGIIKENNILTFVGYGFAIAFKLQAVFFLPFLLFYWFYSKRYSLLHFIISFVTMLACNIPAFLQGRTLKEAITIYAGNSSLYESISSNYPSFWLIMFSNEMDAEQYAWLKPSLILVAISAIAVHMIIWIKKNVVLKKEFILYMAFLSIYTAVMFMPEMHDRYGYVYEMLALIIVFVNIKTAIPYILMMITTMQIYGPYLFRTEINLFMLAIINVVAYVAYCALIYKRFSVATTEQCS